MRYRRAVERLRMIADACQHTTRWPPDDEPFLREEHVFGEVLDGGAPVDYVQLALMLNLPSEEVPWESHPRGAEWRVRTLRLDKGGAGTGGDPGTSRCGTTTPRAGSVQVGRRS